MIAYVDMFSGISGDMMLGALIDLGVPCSWLMEKLSAFLSGFNLKTEQVFRHHLKAIDLLVETQEDKCISRNYKDICFLIEKAVLPEKVKQNSLSVFEKLALAEAQIHGQDIETIHFHEIGGIDSIVDIVGTFLCLDFLHIDDVYGSFVPLGSGVIHCSHGTLPVPVPAVLAILKDVPVITSDATTEIVTPTGAAIIKSLAQSFGPMPAMHIKKIGYGAGKRQTGSRLPNILRVIMGEKISLDKNQDAVHETIQKQTIQILSTHIDDMNPEITGYLMETLFEKDALDVAFTPIHMKKNRPGIKIEVLCKKEHLHSITRVLFSETSSLGIRVQECDRFVLFRESETIHSSFGPLEVKKVIGADSKVRYIPEYDVLKKTAKHYGLPLQEVYRRVLQDIYMLDRE